MTSSPGLCEMRHLGSTNAEVFKWNGLTMDPYRVEMVKAAVKIRFENLLQGNLEADDIMIFIKQEPHKVAKIEEGRFRLISAVSLIDTLIDRIVFGWLARSAMATVGRTPSMVGWTPLHGGWRSLANKYFGRAVLCLDKSCWDWTVNEWLILFWLEFIKNIAVGASNWWLSLVERRFIMLFRYAVFRFRDGTRVFQPCWGIMKSGCFLTILLNTVGQSFAHYRAYYRMGLPCTKDQPRALGDDTVQRAIRRFLAYVAMLESFGIRVKGSKIEHWIEFAGFLYTPEVCIPAYWKKHLFNIYNAVDVSNLLESYLIIYANDPVMFEYLTQLSLQFNPDCVLTAFEAKSIMNYDC